MPPSSIKTRRYRRYIARGVFDYRVEFLEEFAHELPSMIEIRNWFVRWIDMDWQDGISL